MGPRKQSPAAGALVTKWSIKPADHNAARVRNNQRRHRERVKSRIENLEAKLAETQAALEEALQTIKDLNAEVEGYRRTAPDTSITPAALLHQSPISFKSLEGLICKCCKSDGNSSDAGQGPLLGGTAGIDSLSAEHEDESSMRPQVTGESTTCCREAFKMLAEQNYASLDTPAMRAWLEPGFRRGISAGEGCRVTNSLLFALLSHISS